MNLKDIDIVFSNQETRILACENRLDLFAYYYFSEFCFFPDADFQRQAWADLNNPEYDFFIDISFRESGKTARAMIKAIHAIVYKQKRFLNYYCFDKTKSKARLFDIAVQLQTNERIIEDFGQIFWAETGSRGRESKKKSIGEFITDNAVKVKAFSIGESPRGEIYAAETVFRPDLIIMDDVDVLKTVANPKMVEKNYQFIKEEIFGGAAQDANKIFLGNIISNDTVGTRLIQESKNNESWKLLHVAAETEGIPAWDRYVMTDEEAEKINSETENKRFHRISLEKKRRDLGEIAYNRSFLNIPYVAGDAIIRREYVTMFEYAKIKNRWKHFTFIIGVDPSISEKEHSDPFGISVVGLDETKEDIKKYVCESHELTGKRKKVEFSIDYIAKLYEKFSKISGQISISVENNAFQAIFEKLLQEKGLACVGTTTHKDKTTRLMERQAEIERGDVLFSDSGFGIPELIEQMVNFPNVINDDRMDAFLFGIDDGNIPERIFSDTFDLDDDDD